MKPIALFYHCLFYCGDPAEYRPKAINIIREQMRQVELSGLLEVCQHMLVGINGGEESTGWAGRCLPSKAQMVYHGLNCRNENKTIFEMEQWAREHPDWHVLYFHAKGATKNDKIELTENWRRCMMRNLVVQWRQCVADLRTHDAVGCHWMSGEKTPPGQSIFAGNFWWANSSFLQTLPSIMERPRIKLSGIGALESRYESEVWLGNGPRLPRVRDYHPAWIDQCKP